MANHVSALKRNRITERRTAINQMRKSKLRTQVRSMRRLIEKKDAAAATKLLPETFSLIDRASKWGIIHASTAARYKSRIHFRLKALSAKP
jgi:small subunit ribosomal protein S20